MIIYKITNKIDSKVYIGQTIGSIEKRWKAHIYDHKRKDFVLYRAMRKYGIDKFTIEEIDGANSLSELNYKEWFLIHRFNSLAPNGYNSATGGKNSKPTQEVKNKISKAHIGKIVTKEARKNMSVAQKGKKQPKETINKRKNAMLNNPKMSKKIVRNDGVVFPSISECARQSETSTGNICMVIKGDRAQSNGFHFKYLSDFEDIKNIKPWDIPYPPEKKIKRSDGVIFNSIDDAAKKMNTSKNNIARVLRGVRKTHKGYYFKYLESK